MDFIDGATPSKHHRTTERLPAKNYYRISSNIYAFPGAEIWCNDDDKDDQNDTNYIPDNDDIDMNCVNRD